VGRPRFDFLADADQKTLKVGIHSFPAWRSALERDSMKIGRQVRLLCVSLGKALNKIASTFEWLDL